MSKLILSLGVPATTPSTGQMALYAKSDGKLYVKNDAGFEAVLAAPVTDILQGSGGETILQGIHVASAVNNLTVTNAVLSSHPVLTAVGTDANININLAPKGLGTVAVSSSRITDIANPIGPQDAVTVDYADITYSNVTHNHDASYSLLAHTHTSTYVDLSGSIMTGALTLPGDPINNLHATTKQYVDGYNNTLSGAVQIQDIVGGMVSTNVETGINVTYDTIQKKLDFNVDDFTITLGGDLSGSVVITDLASVTLTATVADDSHAHDLLYYNKSAADTKTIELRSEGSVLVQTAVGPLTLTNANHIVVVNQTVPAAIVINLPAGSGLVTGKMFRFKDGKGDANINNITITPNGIETIDSAASLIMTANYQSAEILWNGTEWNIL